jgi:hypothetical protein
MASWNNYTDNQNSVDNWRAGSGVMPFVEQVAAAKGAHLVLCLTKAKLNGEAFKYQHRIQFDKIWLLDTNIFIRIDGALDITAEVMAAFWADLQSKM